MKNYSDYLGKEFEPGINDCYTIVRDFYKKEFNIDLPNFARYDGWWNDGLNLYMQHAREVGFYLLDDLDKPIVGDVYLMCLQSPVPSHAAVWVGENKILHHVQNRLSRIDEYRGVFRNFTVSRWRHESLKNKEPERKEYEIIKRVDDGNNISI